MGLSIDYKGKCNFRRSNQDEIKALIFFNNSASKNLEVNYNPSMFKDDFASKMELHILTLI